MKITKQRLKEIIKEELNEMGDAMHGAERPGAGIEDIAQREVEDDSSHVAELLGTPEGTAIAKIMARKIIDQFARFDELADAIEGIDRDEVTTRVVAAMRDNPMYDPMEEKLSPSGEARRKEERAREAKIQHYMSTQGLSLSAAKEMAGRTGGQTSGR